ncbi:MAG TPA: hypothetical protein VMT64_00385 [Candidatus Binataceae bacterium]|nr:hypothetical protein [Candidatus Binataceae bacterium]
MGSLIMAPARSAFADQVLEIPSTVAPTASTPSDYSRTMRTSHPAPLPSNLGTLQDYERETDADSNTGNPSNYPSNHGAGSVNPLFEVKGNDQQALLQSAVLGALLIGAFAMEMHAAHHHHRHY